MGLSNSYAPPPPPPPPPSEKQEGEQQDARAWGPGLDLLEPGACRMRSVQRAPCGARDGFELSGAPNRGYTMVTRSVKP